MADLPSLKEIAAAFSPGGVDAPVILGWLRSEFGIVVAWLLSYAIMALLARYAWRRSKRGQRLQNTALASMFRLIGWPAILFTMPRAWALATAPLLGVLAIVFSNLSFWGATVGWYVNLFFALFLALIQAWMVFTHFPMRFRRKQRQQPLNLPG